MNAPHSISIVLPCYNEQETIERTIEDVRAWIDASKRQVEIVAVDDGSADRTGEILRELARRHATIQLVRHEANRGYGAAVISGCDRARFERIGFMDSDGQFLARDFETLLPSLERSDLVVGRRRHRADPLFRSLNAGLYGGLVRLVLGIRVRDINCGMKVFTRDLWPRIRPRYGKGALFNAELFLRAKGAGVRWIQLPVGHHPRRAGKPTGARPAVVLRMFRELFELKRAYRSECRSDS